MEVENNLPEELSGDALTGKRFGNFTAIRPTDHKNRGITVWECRCKCGKTVLISENDLIEENYASCGRCKEPKTKRRGKKKVAGRKYGILTPLEPTGERQAGNIIWKCRCDCGNTTYVTTTCLTSGRTQSCGCLRKRTKNGKYIGRTSTRNK